MSLEHLLIKNDQVSVVDEHMISQVGPLKLIEGFCGADEVLTNYSVGADFWVGRFINSAQTKEGLEEKRRIIRENIGKLQVKSKNSSLEVESLISV